MESLLLFIHGIWKYFAKGSVTKRKWVVHTLMQVKTLRDNFSRVSGERLSTFSLSKPCESMIVKEGTRPLFVQGIFFILFLILGLEIFSKTKKGLLLIVLLKERFTSKTVIWLTNENLGLKIHLSSLLIPFLGLLAIYHDLIYVHLFLLRKLERETKTEISRGRVGSSVFPVL